MMDNSHKFEALEGSVKIEDITNDEGNAEIFSVGLVPMIQTSSVCGCSKTVMTRTTFALPPQRKWNGLDILQAKTLN